LKTVGITFQVMGRLDTIRTKFVVTTRLMHVGTYTPLQCGPPMSVNCLPTDSEEQIPKG